MPAAPQRPAPRRDALGAFQRRQDREALQHNREVAEALVIEARALEERQGQSPEGAALAGGGGGGGA